MFLCLLPAGAFRVRLAIFHHISSACNSGSVLPMNEVWTVVYPLAKYEKAVQLLS